MEEIREIKIIEHHSRILEAYMQCAGNLQDDRAEAWWGHELSCIGANCGGIFVDSGAAGVASSATGSRPMGITQITHIYILESNCPV